jgi:hypothetical protein
MDEINQSEQSQPLSEPQEVKKELSPEEVAQLASQRAVFRRLHDYFADTDIYQAEGNLGALEGLLNSKFMELAAKTKVADLGITADDELTKNALAIFEGLSVQDAITYVRALVNATTNERYNKTKSWTVKELGITLL